MEIKDMDTIDRAAMLVGTGLMFVGVVVLGLIETFDGAPAGNPASAAPIMDGETVVATPGLDPNIRTAFVVAGLLVLLLYAGYKLATPAREYEARRTTSETPAQ